MKVVIDIDDYILDTDIDSDWVNVCNDELAESLNNAVKLSDVLQEMRNEIMKNYNVYSASDKELDNIEAVGMLHALSIVNKYFPEDSKWTER